MTQQLAGRSETPTPPENRSGGMTAGLTLSALTALVVGSMIGSGIFALPANMAVSAAPGPLLIGWAITGGVDGVVIGTRPEHALATMREAAELGLTRVWMHRAFGGGSVSDEATEYGRAHGITVIDGGCPLMFAEGGDKGHRVMCKVLTWTKKVPREVG